jgi:hypothetical protein
VDAHPDELILRGLPEGDADLVVELSHPYFVPAVLRVPIRATLERGSTETVAPVVPAIGGSIHVEPQRAVAARITRAGGEPRLAAADGGRIAFDNLASGRYGVELCDDTGCATVSRAWDDVEVVPARTIELRVDSP